jgi:hypothetical protein
MLVLLLRLAGADLWQREFSVASTQTIRLPQQAGKRVESSGDERRKQIEMRKDEAIEVLNYIYHFLSLLRRSI